MPMFIRNREEYKQHPVIEAWGLKVVSKMKYLGLMLDSKLDWYPHTQYLENKVALIRNNLVRCSRATWGMSFYNLMTVYKYGILPVIIYASEAWSTLISKRAKNKLQQIQRSCLIFITKAYRTVSNEALSAIAGIMPIDQAMHLYKDIRAVSRGQPTNSVLPELKKIEIPTKTKGIHPKDNYISVDFSGTEGKANVAIYTDGSKTVKHVGAGMVVVKDSCEIHIESQKLNITCTVYQAELYGITMAVNWIHNQRKKAPSYAINVDSKAALLSIANKHTTHPLAVAARLKTIELGRYTSVAFYWVKGHAGLEGNERADYLAKTAASYNTTIAYNAIPINLGKQILEDYYIKLWNETYINSTNASHTKPFIPTIFHRLSLSLWPNFILTQFLTNHGSFRSYLHKMNKTPSPICKCPEKAVQTARHLLTECSLFSTERPTVLQTLAPHLVLKHYINTISITSFLKSIFHTLQEQD
jgi:ribonuclease HI